MNFSRHLYAILGISAILTAASMGSTRLKAAAPASSNVLVTNTASQPVPTVAQGTTQVAGTVGLAANTKVGINGTVSLASGVSGTPLYVRDQDVSGHIPVHKNCEFTIDNNTNSKGGIDLYIVPNNKILVIETVYGTAANPSGQQLMSGGISTYDGTTEHDIPLPFLPGRDGGGFEKETCFSDSRIYVEPGAFVVANALRTGSTGLSLIDVGFSGYLMDAP